jgi:putative ABC transport system permease protein
VESVFLSLFSFTIALVIVELLTPAYLQIIQKQISLHIMFTPGNLGFLISIVIFCGIISGSYPAFVIASFNPLNVIKGNLKSSIKSIGLRNYLVVIQFSISILIMIFTCSVYRQLIFMNHRDLGFDKERAFVIKRSDGLKNHIEAFKQEVERIPEVLAIANSTHIPGKNYWYNSFFKESEPGNAYLLYHSLVSRGYDDALGIQMKEGHFFVEGNSSDSLGAVINEAAAKKLGFNQPIGKSLIIPLNKKFQDKLTIIGVMKDFNFKSLHYKVEPMIMTLMRKNIEGFIVVRVKTRNVPKTVTAIQQKWDYYTSDYPFEYFWLDNDFSKLYSTEKRIASLFLSFSIFSIFIACLGLFGLIAFTAGMRMKEIGIRKSMGATFEGIVFMLTRDTFKLIAVALLISWPLSYFIITLWLQDFSYRIPINFQDFIWVALASAFISFFTIFFQAAKAAKKNPSDAMRYE